MERSVKVKCPYCGAEMKVSPDGEYVEKKLVHCDVMEGGCDRDFVVDIRVSVEVKALKIEGEGEGTHESG